MKPKDQLEKAAKTLKTALTRPQLDLMCEIYAQPRKVASYYPPVKALMARDLVYWGDCGRLTLTETGREMVLCIMAEAGLPSLYKRVTLTRLSFCKCGFPVLKDEIKLGAVYFIDPSKQVEGFTYTCGGCSSSTQVNAVWTAARPPSGSGYLPVNIFE